MFLLRLLAETYNEWMADKASRLAAALAYYSIFALAPIVIIAISVAGLVFGREAAQGEMLSQIRDLAGPEGTRTVQTVLEGASKPAASIGASIAGLFTLFLGATGVFVSLQDGLNTVWEVAPDPSRGWIRGMILDRLHSFALVLGVGFVLLVSLAISAGLALAGKYFAPYVPWAGMVQWLNLGISFAVVALLFAMIYKFLPDVEIRWGDVWIGAAVTSMLFTLGKSLIGLYLGHSTVASTYGAAGSLVIVLIWIYYSAQLVFLGAEFTQVYANRYGSKIKPKRNAVPLTELERRHQGIPHDLPKAS